jgi:hypothetical protein
VSRMLAHTKSEGGQLMLKGQRFAGMAADNGRGVLWLLTAYDSRNDVDDRSRWPVLYRYTPEQSSLERCDDERLVRLIHSNNIGDTSYALRRNGDSLLIWTGGGWGRYDTVTGEATDLFGDGWRCPEGFNAWQGVLLTQGLACAGSDRIAMFRHGVKDPAMLIGPWSEPRAEIRDLVSAAEGLYVLTSKALCLIPGVK